jgi:FlaA1/EpsC-like NDP-sugar epimerase
MISILLNLSRISKQALMIVFDFISVICLIHVAFWARLGYIFNPSENYELMIVIYGSPVLALPIFASFGLYREIIRYVSFTAFWRIMQASSVYAASWGLIIFMINIEWLPRSVILINWLLVVLIICGSRFFARWLLSANNYQNNVIIYGAGSAGRQLSNALKHSNEYNPVAFIDDSNEINNHSINGLKVYNPIDLQHLIDNKNVSEVLIAMPSLKRSRRGQIISFLEPYKVVVRSLPGVTELAQGKIKVNDIHEIDLKDLLGRESIKPNNDLFKKNITNKVVMVTGAGGSIGSELCRQILTFKPKILVLYEMSESSLYQIDQELTNLNFNDVEIFPVIGTILASKLYIILQLINMYLLLNLIKCKEF